MKAPCDIIIALEAESLVSAATMPAQASDTRSSLDYREANGDSEAPTNPEHGEESHSPQLLQGSDDEDEELEATAFERLVGLVDIEIGRKHKRPMCASCGRPQSVCWCQNNSATLQHVQSTVLVLQHPHEEKRCLRTAPMLQNALPRCTIHKGKKFSTACVPELASPDAVLLFPGPGAVEVSNLPTVRQRGRPYTLVVLDGTWHQARAIMHKTPELHRLPKVVVRSDVVSQYVIRTQPSDAALSTVESAALALAALEDDPTIYSALVQPLVTLCKHQLSHGAVVHHSKERRCREVADIPIGKRTAKTLAQCGARPFQSSDDGTADNKQTDMGDASTRFLSGDAEDCSSSVDTTSNPDRDKCSNIVESCDGFYSPQYSAAFSYSLCCLGSLLNDPSNSADRASDNACNTRYLSMLSANPQRLSIRQPSAPEVLHNNQLQEDQEIINCIRYQNEKGINQANYMGLPTSDFALVI